MKKRGDIEQIFIKNANFEFLPDFRPARGKNGENEGVRNGGENDRNKINDYCFLQYTTSYAFRRIAWNIFLSQKTPIGGSTMRPQ